MSDTNTNETACCCELEAENDRLRDALRATRIFVLDALSDEKLSWANEARRARDLIDRELERKET